MTRVLIQHDDKLDAARKIHATLEERRTDFFLKPVQPHEILQLVGAVLD